ncbi:Division abnormally delayed protein [Melipona quadrifasciata]|uniref:Division abnormally delayed protein n=1 Tax=Melipona quadrifasciata TaxID=166423 RepID=A0A0N0BHN6_9HYME|nr:Division abnormally delayed protein [Melipona quadrifasciata]
MLARQSENKTLTLFDQVYRAMAVLSRPSIKALYQAMVDYVSASNTPDTLQQPLTRDMLQERFIEFFTKLFPIAYHKAVNSHPYEQDFTEKFKTCLYETMDEIQPFGDIPKQVAKSVSKSLEATRVLVQALTLGKTVLDKTDSVLFSVDVNVNYSDDRCKIHDCKNKIESEESSDEEVVSFTRRRNHMQVKTLRMLEELAIAEEEELNNDGDSLDNIQWNEFANKQQSFTFTGKSGLLMELPSNISPGEVLSLFLDEKSRSIISLPCRSVGFICCGNFIKIPTLDFNTRLKSQSIDQINRNACFGFGVSHCL